MRGQDVIVSTNKVVDDITKGLLVHYTLDADGNDSSGNLRHATEYGTPTYEAGKVNNAVRLDGSTQYLEDANGGTYLNGLNSFSICCWAYQAASGDTPVWCLNTVEYDSATDTGTLLRFDPQGYDTSATDCFKLNINDTPLESESFLYATSVWVHIVITWESGFIPNIYVDGVKKTWGNGVAISGGITSDVLGIGRGNKLGYMNGLLDDFRVYNRKLSEAEIAEVYNLGV